MEALFAMQNAAIRRVVGVNAGGVEATARPLRLLAASRRSRGS